jgi:hypothetical protein
MRFFLLMLVIFNISCAQKTEETQETQEIKKQSESNPQKKILPTSFEHCRLRAINQEQPNYINVCKTSIGNLSLDDYLRSLDLGSDSTLDFKIIEETEFLSEDIYPSSPAKIDRSQLSESQRRIAQLGRVSDSKKGLRSKDQNDSSDSVNEQIRQINEARERLRRERELNSYLDLSNNLRTHLRSSNPIKRVGIISLMEALSSKKEFEGEFGESHEALREKMRLIVVDDIKSYKLIGSFAQTFLRSEKEFKMGDRDFALELLRLSESLLDVGLGLDPGSKLVKDTFELTFGHNIVTGAELSSEERGRSLLGVRTGLIRLGAEKGIVSKLADHFGAVSLKFVGTPKIVFDEAVIEAGETNR